MRLSEYVEQISDDFQSTFTVVDENTLGNMLGFPTDFARLTKIIHKYIPNAELEFIKTNRLGAAEIYDIYLVRDVTARESSMPKDELSESVTDREH